MSEATIIVKTKEPNTVNTISHDTVILGNLQNEKTVQMKKLLI